MITKAKLVFLSSCALSGYIIYRVHDYQQEERNVNFDKFKLNSNFQK